MNVELLADFVTKAIRRQDVPAIITIIEKIGFRGSGVPHRLALKNWTYLSLVLGQISVYSVCHYEEFFVRNSTERIIDLIAMDVNIFDLLDLVEISDDSVAKSKATLPKRIRDAVKNDEFDAEIGQKILSLDCNKFKALVRYILNNIDTLGTEFNLPIIQYISKNLIPPSRFLLYVTLCPRQDFDELEANLVKEVSYRAVKNYIHALQSSLLPDGWNEGLT